LAKWKQVSLHLPTGLNNSCYHPPLHKIPVENLAADPGSLHNTPHKKAQRVMMLHNKKPEECQYCWNMEAENKLSDRHYRSGEPWAAVDFEKIQNSTGEESDVIPSYVEVNFNNVCNLMCSYCSPQFSSSWQQEVDRSGGYPTARVHNDPGHFGGDRRVIPVREHNPYVEAFWAWWPTLYPELVHFRMTGGEPLMDKNTFRMFDYVKEHPSEKLHLSITSNCCPPKGQWDKFMTSLKEITDADAVNHFMLFCSLDSWGAQAEYIRNGLDFCTLYTNITDYLKNSSKHSLTFIITFNALSYTGFVKYIENIHKLRQEYNTDRQLIWFDIPMLNDPMWMNPKLLPEMVAELERAIEFMKANEEGEHNRFKGFKDFEISKVQRLIDWVKSDSKFDRATAMKNFYLFFSQHDERRGTSFLNTFPELTDFWNTCEKT
jgi:pyruvate-formate lyase-activating enzyme